MLSLMGGGCIRCSWIQWAKALWLIMEVSPRHRRKERTQASHLLAFPAEMTSKESSDVEVSRIPCPLKVCC